MSAFVILAAGRGTRIGRVGESLHKALVPLGPKAVISHLFDLVPPDVRIIIATGHRSDQLEEYVRLAHPTRHPEFVYVNGWDDRGGGPGHSLLAVEETVGRDDFAFTSCDTLWDDDPGLWMYPARSWSAVAAVPAGTSPTRWCRMSVTEDGHVDQIYDKRPGGNGAPAYVGLSHVSYNDLVHFWSGLRASRLHDGELQVSGGLDQLRPSLEARPIKWTDVGDEVSYRRAVATYVGYDWTKTDEATYLLPDEGRVVKFFADQNVTHDRHARGYDLGDAVPHMVDYGKQFLAYEYARGPVMYDALEQYNSLDLVRLLIAWGEHVLWDDVQLDHQDGSDLAFEDACMRFYRDKTFARVDRLPRDLRSMCLDIVSRVDWDDLCAGAQPSKFHGDFNFGNIIVTGGGFVGIDWRQDFAGLPFGDRRYDYAKLLAGCVVHWGNARTGDFRRWGPRGDKIADMIIELYGEGVRDLRIIAALSLLNSAPLHASPLDEILVARGCAWLEDAL